MAYLTNTDYLIEVAKGNVAGASLVNKFGANISLASSYEVVSIGGVYQTPQVSGATALYVRSSNNNDTAFGSGAREITIQGLDATGVLTTASIATNGTSNSANFAGTWLRVFRAWVSGSGTYATLSAPSHIGSIELRSATSGTWLTIDATDIAKGQSQVGSYTVPLGFTAYLLDYVVTMDSGKTVDFAFFTRENILETAAPYTAMRLLLQEMGLTVPFARKFGDPIKIPELTDIGFFAEGATTPSVTVDFNLLLIEN